MDFGVVGMRTLIGRVLPKKDREQQYRKLTFGLTRDYPDKIAISDESGFRAAGPCGKSAVYSIGGAELSASEEKLAEALKADMILNNADYLYGSGKALSDRVNDAYRLAMSSPKISASSNKGLIAYLVAHDVAGYGPFSVLLDDAKSIEEIMVDRIGANINIYHSKLGYCRTNLIFRGASSFRFNVNRLIEGSEKELSESQPIIDAQLFDGSRLHAQLKAEADGGGVLAIRLNGGRRFGIDRLLKEGTATPEMLAYMWMAIEVGYNIIIAGAPASGKTSMLLSLLSFVPRYDRVIVIEEEANELVLSSNFMNSTNLNGSSKHNSASLEAQVINALHLRPDRIVIGELRGAETRNVFSAANLGVPFMATMHSNIDGHALIERLTTKPMSVEPEALHSLDVALFMKHSDAYKRSIDRITEYRWVTRAEADMQDTGSRTYEQLDIFADGKLANEVIKSSKVVRKYSDMMVVSRKKAISELSDRAEYLIAAASKGKDMDGAIQEYG
ncbi:MAG: ATPase, T2SS/T4P/T4SS family [Candidatus Micrarchaeia archaeon]